MSDVADRVGKLRESCGPTPDVTGRAFVRDVRDAIGPEALTPIINAGSAMTSELSSAVADESVLSGLGGLRTHDSYTFDHSIDVTILGVLLAKRAGFDRRQMRLLSIGLLLHDLGKIFIDPTILNKPGKLTDAEFERMKSHPEVGYGMCKALIDDQGPLPPHVAYQHHEKQDGSGYPRGLIGSNALASVGAGSIHPFGSFAAVADVYDALASDRPYRSGMPADKACRIIHQSAGGHLNREVVELFGEIVAPYPTGGEVVIESGRWVGHTAVIVSHGKATFGRPKVRLFADAAGDRVPPQDIDLAIEEDVKFSGTTARRARDVAAAA
jgi:HD-GYP domain-containing protein (c-di-GMP phosphodiesterase class II)